MYPLTFTSQGADTIVWLMISDAAWKAQSGLFWQDRKAVSTHLPLAWTRSSKGDEDSLMETLKQFNEQFQAKL